MNAEELRSAIRKSSRELARLLDMAESASPGSGPNLSEEDFAAVNQDVAETLTRAAGFLVTAGFVDDDLLAKIEDVADAVSDSGS
jgi:hypothetical protein